LASRSPAAASQWYLAHYLCRHCGAVSQIIGNTLEQTRVGATNPLLVIFFAAFTVALVGFIVFMERAQRRLFVTYPKRQVGNKVYGGDSSHLPLKLNVSGVIPADLRQLHPAAAHTVASFNAQNLPEWLQTIVTYPAVASRCI